jgi:SWI/SNF-related matrix-associated actin-dependent regulator 1 of chromatin subfamily A
MSFGLDLDNMLKAGPGLIICPNTLCLNWQQEWDMVAGRRSIILNNKTKENWQKYYEHKYVDVFIINYDGLKKFFVQPGWTKPKEGKLHSKSIPYREKLVELFKWIIIDESHKCKEANTLRTKFVIGITRKKDIVMELTGTSVVNKPHDLIPQLVIIDRLKDIVSHIPQPRDAHGKLIDWTGLQRFMTRYCSVDEHGNYLNQKELNYRLNKVCFYRREKAQVLKDLPDKTRQIVLCDITNRTEYDKAFADLKTYLKEVRNCTDKDIKKKMKAEVLVRIGVLKQISARGKIEAAQEAIDEVLDAGQKIVIFCNLKEIVQQVKDLYPNAVSVTGSDSLDIRDRNIKSFQTDPSCNIIVCNIKTGGVGITLTASSEVLFIEFPWTFADCTQCEDRTHRIGQKESVRARYLLGEGTIDRWCYNLIVKKRSIASVIAGDEHTVDDEIVDDLFNLFNQE